MAGKGKKTTSDGIYQLKITLKDIKPPVWRRVEVPGEFTLGRLHTPIQMAMGWEGGHLHQYTVFGMEYGMPEEDLDMGVEDEDRITLDRLPLHEKVKFHYVYDFGDDWQHEILVEKILPRVAGKTYPVCVKGKRACPPEDVGAVWGYADFLEILGDREHPQREEMMVWVGGGFNPEAFDPDQVNRRLRDSF